MAFLKLNTPPAIRLVWRQHGRWAGPVFVAFLGAALAYLYYWGGDLHRFTQGISAYIALFIGQFGIYLIASFLVLNGRFQASKRSKLILVVIVLGFSALFRAELVGRQPYLSTDAYRYVWDGRVQAHHINPFRYIPSAPQLFFLRDRSVFPNINGAYYERTPYPPAAEIIFLGIYASHPLSINTFKLAFSLFDLITIGALMIVLARSGLDPARAVIYAWHPLIIWEGVHSGHVDIVFIMFLALALLSWSYKKPVLTGAALAAATLIKLYPALLLPIFLFSTPQTLATGGEEYDGPASLPDMISRIPSVIFTPANRRMIAGFIATVVLCYLPYLSDGSGALTYTQGYLQEEGFVRKGGRYLLLTVLRKIVRIPTPVFITGALIALAILGLWWLLRPKLTPVDVARGSVAMIGLLLLLTTPRYPWYFCWLVPFLCFDAGLAWLYLSGATILLYTLWFIPEMYPGIPMWLGAALYLPVILMLLSDRTRRRFRRRTLEPVPA